MNVSGDDELPAEGSGEEEGQIISGAEALADQAGYAQSTVEPEAESQGFLNPEMDQGSSGEAANVDPTDPELDVSSEVSGDLSADPAALGEEPAALGDGPNDGPVEFTGLASEPELTDPDLSVDDLLSAAVLAEGLPAAEEAPGIDAPPGPNFQLHLHQISETQKASLKKLLEAHGLSLPDSNAGAPVVSQLSEYQAVLLLQQAKGLGIRADVTVVLPDALPPSEDDLALGDLSLVPELDLPQVESAPSVNLPKGEKDVMLCTPTQMPGVNTVETLGIVIAHRSIARRLFREEDLREKLERELKSVPGKIATTLASSHLQQILRDLLLDLRKAALSKGGNAVLGVKMEAFPESTNTDPLLEQLRLVAFGTCAVVDKS